MPNNSLSQLPHTSIYTFLLLLGSDKIKIRCPACLGFTQTVSLKWNQFHATDVARNLDCTEMHST